jgi:hypothetical protein
MRPSEQLRKVADQVHATQQESSAITLGRKNRFQADMALKDEGLGIRMIAQQLGCDAVLVMPHSAGERNRLRPNVAQFAVFTTRSQCDSRHTYVTNQIGAMVSVIAIGEDAPSSTGALAGHRPALQLPSLFRRRTVSYSVKR